MKETSGSISTHMFKDNNTNDGVKKQQQTTTQQQREELLVRVWTFGNKWLQTARQ